MPSHGDDLAGLKARLRLSAIVGRRVKLRKKGPDFFGVCPFHTEKTGSFSVNDAKGFFYCFGCNAQGDVLDWWQRSEGLTFADAVERLRREAGALPVSRPGREDDGDAADCGRRQADARAIWAATRPIFGTPAETYLRQARCIGIELPDCLRFHPALSAGPDGHAFPAMVAGVTDLAGAVVAVQRTFLTPGGNAKAPVPSPKRSLGPIGKGAVMLAPAAPTLGIAEGIETGLSAMELFALPVWCALGSHLSRMALPPRVRQVVIFADRGEAGERAAEAAREVFRAHGRKVAVRFATTGKDFNDQLRARRHGTRQPPQG